MKKEIQDSYINFLKYFKINKKEFFEYGKKSIIYANSDDIDYFWKDLKYRLYNNQKVYIRSYGNNGVNSKIFVDFIKKVFNNENIEIDKNRNSIPQAYIKKYTQLERKKDIINYQVSHLFERTKNPLMFECPWNIAYIPKIYDPFTGHESNGNWTKEFQEYYLKDAQHKFKKYIDDYNSIIKSLDIEKKISNYIDGLKKYSNNQKNRFKKDLEENFKPIIVSTKTDIHYSEKEKIGEFVYYHFKKIEQKYNGKLDTKILEELTNPEISHIKYKMSNNLSVLKEYNENGGNKQHYLENYQRYKSPHKMLYCFNGKKYMITKELYENQRLAFNELFEKIL